MGIRVKYRGRVGFRPWLRVRVRVWLRVWLGVRFLVKVLPSKSEFKPISDWLLAALIKGLKSLEFLDLSPGLCALQNP